MCQIFHKSAYILHVRDYRDSSKIADIITPDFGRVSVVIKGVKRSSKKIGLAQPFSPLMISWSGRGDLKTAISIEPAGPPLMLKGDRLYCGIYINELILRLIKPFDQNPELFDLYHYTLQKLPHDSIEPLLRIFEKNALDLIGIGLMLKTDIYGMPINSGKNYNYRIDLGAEETVYRVSQGLIMSGAGLIVSGAVLLALREEDFTQMQDVKGVKNFMRAVVQYHIGDRPLRSRELFR